MKGEERIEKLVSRMCVILRGTTNHLSYALVAAESTQPYPFGRRLFEPFLS